MDARLALAISLPLALAACSSAPQAPAQNPGLEVFEQLITEPAAPDSILRQGDLVKYIVVPTVAKPFLARFEASCNGPIGSMYYHTKVGMEALTDDEPTGRLPQPQLQVLQHSEQLRAACAYRSAPDWRVLDTGTDQDWLALDRNSARDENGLLKVWTARFLAEYQVAARTSLVAQLQERWAIDCTQRTLKRLSKLSVDASGGLLVGELIREEQALTPAQQDSAQQRLLEVACRPSADWATLATPPPRTPRMPQLQTPVAAPAVLAAIDALQLPPSRLNLQAVSYSYDTLMINGGKIADVKREDVFTTDEHSGQLLLQPKAAMPGTKLRLTFRGLIDLASRSFDRHSGEQVADASPVIGLSFKGDWQHLPEGSDLAYSLTQQTATGPFTSTITCTVGTARLASQINPALQGMAKPLTCTKLKTKRVVWTVSYSYLEDYGVFVQAAENSPLGQWTWRVDSVR